MFLPAPITRALDERDDLTKKRSRMWREIQARRKDKRGKTVFRGAFALGFAVAACVCLLVVYRPQLSRLAQSPVVSHTAPREVHTGALTEADGRTVQNWSAHAQRRVVALSDESEIRLEPGTEIRPTRSNDSRFELLLARGAAEFSVTPGGPRRWVIEAGRARVEVLGTVFRVERGAESVRVSVSRGRVLVVSDGLPGGRAYLTVGQSVEAGPALPAPEAAAPVAEETAVAAAEPSQETAAELPEVSAPVRARVTRQGAAEAPWKRHVSEGRFAEAYDSLGHDRFLLETARAKTPEALLSLADAARLSGHPADAVPPLERVLTDFGTGPHGALSAFTLGRVFLDQLQKPDRAANAFEQAITLHPPSALLEGCHARLVEAYARAGDMSSAERAAARYRTLFPAGRHDVDVRSWKKRD
jgi:transmembrane sensor